METYINVDQAGSIVNKKSTSGYYANVWGNLETWWSKKKQNVVA